MWWLNSVQLQQMTKSNFMCSAQFLLSWLNGQYRSSHWDLLSLNFLFGLLMAMGSTRCASRAVLWSIACSISNAVVRNYSFFPATFSASFCSFLMSSAVFFASVRSALTYKIISQAGSWTEPPKLIRFGCIERTMLSLSLAKPSSHSPLPSFCFFNCACLISSTSSARPSVSAISSNISIYWRPSIAVAADFGKENREISVAYVAWSLFLQRAQPSCGMQHAGRAVRRRRERDGQQEHGKRTCWCWEWCVRGCLLRGNRWEVSSMIKKVVSKLYGMGGMGVN